jgi:NADPH:quinone reductase-like Zn-dependent oxidoreductase
MRALEIAGAFGLDQLRIVERPEPEPGPGQVLVRVRAASLNYRDLLMVQGLYNPRQRLPLVPGSDGAGEVVAVGPGVQRVKAGDRVCGSFAQGWISGRPTAAIMQTTLGGPRDGVLAELVLLDEAGVVPTPEYLSDVEAATLPCAAVTAWSAIVQTGQLGAGDTALLQGTGGVSLFALQIARLFGVRVIITSGSDEKLARAQALGAEVGLNYKTDPHWGDSAKKLTGGVGVDLVLEVGGAATIHQSLRAVRMDGRIALVGNLGGNATELSLPSVFMRRIRIQGLLVGSRETFENLNRALTQHSVKPVVDCVVPFDEVRQAFDRLSSGQHFGKIVVSI